MNNGGQYTLNVWIRYEVSTILGVLFLHAEEEIIYLNLVIITMQMVDMFTTALGWGPIPTTELIMLTEFHQNNGVWLHYQ